MIFDIGGGRMIAAVSLKGQNLLPPWQKSTAKKEPGNPDKDPGNVRNLAYLALCETTKIPEEAGYVGCATCVFTRGVSFIRVSSRRLVVPTQNMDVRHATLSFRAKSVNVLQIGAEEKGENGNVRCWSLDEKLCSCRTVGVE